MKDCDSRFDKAIETTTDKVKKLLEGIWKYQEDSSNYTYRNAYFYDSTNGYYESLAWGNFIGGALLEYHALGYFLLGSEYRSKVLQGLTYYYDFSMGCNHVGRTFTTGLGQYYPVKLLSHPQWWLQQTYNIWDPLPGITLYTFTGQIEKDSIDKLYVYNFAKNDAFTFSGYKIPRSPSFMNMTDPPTSYDTARPKLYSYIPFWHRGTNLEGYTVASSEFTVSETIARMVMEVGMLLESDEDVDDCLTLENCPSVAPTSEQINKQPKDRSELLGRWSIP